MLNISFSHSQELKKQNAEDLEAERSKAKQDAAAAAQAANDRMQKKIETVQRQMQGKIEAAEKEKKKQVGYSVQCSLQKFSYTWCKMNKCQLAKKLHMVLINLHLVLAILFGLQCVLKV